MSRRHVARGDPGISFRAAVRYLCDIDDIE
jgi:hypothetical protein